MASGGKGSSAKAPSAGQIASGQNAYSVYDALLQQQANMVDQTTPFGTIKYTPTSYETMRLPWGKNAYDTKQVAKTWSAQTSLTPEAQGLLDSYMGGLTGLGQTAQQQQGRVQQLLASPWELPGNAPSTSDLPAMYNGNWAGLPGIRQLDAGGNMPTVDEGSRDNMLRDLMAFQQPQIERDRGALATKLANQGVSAGSDAYRSANRDYEDQVARNRLGAVTTAADQARQDAAFNLASRGQQFGEQQAVSNFDLARRGQMFGEESQKQGMSDSRRSNEWNIADAARQRVLSESLMKRQVPLDEYMRLISAMTGGMQLPGSAAAATPQTQIQVPNYGQAWNTQSQYGLAQQQMKQQMFSDIFGGLVGLGGSLGGAGILAPAMSRR